MSGSGRIRRVGAVGLVLLSAVACTETDNQLLDDVGVTRLFLTDPALAVQGVIDPDLRVQAARWSIRSATLDFGNVLVPLVDPENSEDQEQGCVFVDSAFSFPFAEGPCESGIVIEAGEDETASLMIVLESMELRRAEPLDLSRSVDFDADGVLNDGDSSGSAFDAPCGLGGEPGSGCDDNCPLVSNPDQADDNGDGIGNVCTFFDGQSARRDSDGDLIPDTVDNCVWIANPDQADTSGLTGNGFVDGIGDACNEQIATVQIGSILGPFPLVQPTGGTTFLTIDFGEALDCDWESLNCALDVGQVAICSRTDVFDATGGCF